MTPELARDIIKRAMATDLDFATDVILEGLCRGQSISFDTPTSLIIVRLSDDHFGRVAFVQIGGGKLADIRRDLMPKAEAYAQRQGCYAIEMRSRPGVDRAFRASGYVVRARHDNKTITIRKTLEAAFHAE